MLSLIFNRFKKSGFSVFVLLVTLILIPQFAEAKKIESAYYDYDKVIQDIPTWVDAYRQLEEFNVMAQKTLSDMEVAIEKDSLTCYQNNDSNCAIRLQEMRVLLNYKKAALESDSKIWSTRLFGPIAENLVTAIKNVAKKFGIPIIVELDQLTSEQVAVATDLTLEVRAELIRLEKIRMPGL